MDSCGANLPCTFFTFSKRTVDEIDKYIGFWYNKRKKRRICRCTLPMQGLLLATYCGWLYCRSGCTLPMQGLLLAIMLIRPNKSMLHLTYAGIITHLPEQRHRHGASVAPYLCRDYYAGAIRCIKMELGVAPYLCRDYYAPIVLYFNGGKWLHLTYAGIITLVVSVAESPKAGCTLPMQGLLLLSAQGNCPL